MTTDVHGLLLALPSPCKQCGNATGEVRPKSGQNCVYCTQCGHFTGWNAPKAVTGEPVRSLTPHDAIKPGKRWRVIDRANGRCEICGSDENLAVGHLLSVKDALVLGLTEDQINDDENLAAMCELCNAGLSSLSVSPRMLMRLIYARRMRKSS